MSLICALGGHEAGETAYESGYYVSDCRRCGTTMVRAGASWRDLPGGRSLVHEAARQARARASADRAPLPLAGPGDREPAAPPSRTRPSVRPSPPTGAERRTNAAAAPTEAHRDAPALLALAALVGAGLQLALSLRDLRSGF